MEEKKSIKELVIERLAKSGPVSRERLIDAMVTSEEDKRHELLLKAVKLQEQLEGQVKTASRPDVQTFNGDGSPASATFSQNGIKALKSAKDKLTKLSACFDKCLETPTGETFKELEGLLNQGGGAKAPSAEEVRAGN